MHIQDNTGGYIKIADKSAVTASVALQQLDKSAITASVTPQQQLHQSICLKATTSHCKEAKWRDAFLLPLGNLFIKMDMDNLIQDFCYKGSKVKGMAVVRRLIQFY